MIARARPGRSLAWQARDNRKAPTIEQYRTRPAHPGRISGGAAPPGPALVSLVVPVLNGAATLRECLDSALAQEHGATEIVVVDGGSTDGTLDILASYDRAIARWISEPDGGIFDAFNKCVALARGDLIKILNADDRLCRGSVAAAAAAFARNAGSVIRSDLEVIDADGEVVKRMIDTTHPRAPGNLADLFVVLHPSWYVPRRIYETHGLYDPVRRVSGDYEYFLRLVANGVGFEHVDPPLVQFRIGGASAGLANVRERYEVTARYLGPRIAMETASLLLYRKLRSRLLLSLLGPRAFYALRKRIGWRA